MRTLALKYRPQTFDDVVEQGPIKAILQDQIKTKTHKNCYLFTGGAGTGKTTCARIFANELNEGKGNPIELDAASHNSVDDVRNIIQEAGFKSLDSEYRIYIIDECHSLSNSAWQAMLKLIEEPPAQTIFIFCTTDPQKIPATILSRVQRFDFKRISYDSIIERLKYILECENSLDVKDSDLTNIGNISYEDEALSYIAKIADGGMRDAVTLLDKCLSLSTDLTVKNVIDALGTLDYRTMVDLLKMLYERNCRGSIQIVEEVYRSGVDLKQFVKQMQYFVLDAYKLGLYESMEYTQLPNTLETDLVNLNCLDGMMDFEIQLLNDLMKLNSTIKWEQNPKPIIESTFVMLCLEG